VTDIFTEVYSYLHFL